MKVKVGDQVFDPNDVPIMVFLEDEDRERICNMPPEFSRYACYPDEYFENIQAALAWMKQGLSNDKKESI